MPDNNIGNMDDGSSDGSIIPSPITGIMSSINKRNKQPSISRSRKRSLSSRMHGDDPQSIHVIPEDNYIAPSPTRFEFSNSLDSSSNWFEVLFLKSNKTDMLAFQGGRKVKTAGVTIIPEWTPPSPPTANVRAALLSSREACSPKRLLPSSIIKYTDFNDDDDDDDMEGDVSSSSSDDDDDDVPNPPSSYRRPTVKDNHVHDISEKKKTDVMVTDGTSRGGGNKSILPILLTPQSPLATCVIKNLVTTEKICSLPPMVRAQLIMLLPQCDKDSILLNEHKAVETALNNEYINAALREWQDTLALGGVASSYGNKAASKCDHIPTWKGKTDEDWSLSNGNHTPPLVPTIPLHNDRCIDSIPGLTPNQQCIYDALFTSNNTLNRQPSVLSHLSLTTVPRLVSSGTSSLQQPSSSLPVHLPRQHYALNHTRKQILSEHSYCKNRSSSNVRLPLVLKTRCMCLNSPLRMCTLCSKFYHGSCSRGPNICQQCVRRKALDDGL